MNKVINSSMRVVEPYVDNLPANNGQYLPEASDIRTGVTGIAGLTGTLDLPAVADVKLGVVYDNGRKTGTYAP